MEILRCENLTKIYGTENTEIRALDNVTFSVEKGGVCFNCRAFGQRKINTFAHPWRCGQADFREGVYQWNGYPRAQRG